MCEPNDFYLRVFMLWFDRESIIPDNFGFAISVCRWRESGHMSKSKSVYVRVFHDLELTCTLWSVLTLPFFRLY